MAIPIHAYVLIDPIKDKGQRIYVSLLRESSSVQSSVTVMKGGITPRVLVKMDNGEIKRFYGEIAVKGFFERYPKQ